MCYIGLSRGLCPLRTLDTPMAGRAPSRSRRTVIAHTRVTSAELAEWNAKAVGGRRDAVRAAASGDVSDADVDGAGDGGRARAHAAGGSHRLEPESDCAVGEHAPGRDLAPVEVIAHLVAIERELAALSARGRGRC